MATQGIVDVIFFGEKTGDVSESQRATHELTQEATFFLVPMARQFTIRLTDKPSREFHIR